MALLEEGKVQVLLR